MGRPEPKVGDSFTYGDYLTWPDEERWELIEGVPYDMTPAPSTRHQGISVEMSAQFANYLKGKPCQVFAAPFDVRLPRGDEPDEFIPTVVQPDLAVICDRTKLDRRGCRGAPDFVLEILSPSTAAKDQTTKLAAYEKYGVREYWILHPVDRVLTIRTLGENGSYGVPQILKATGRVPVEVLPGFEVDLDSVFEAADAAWPE